MSEAQRERIRRWEDGGRREYEDAKAKLPEPFRRRLARFEANKADFGLEFGAYELCCCVDGALIATKLKTPEAVRYFAKADWDEQQRMVPGLSDGHSGNTFGMACRLAHHYLTDPDLVWREHAAISALVGCDEAGCPPVKGPV